MDQHLAGWKRWALWRIPKRLAPNELKWVRTTWPLPRTWRGLIAEYETREAASRAFDAEPDKDDLFIREVVDGCCPWST